MKKYTEQDIEKMLSRTETTDVDFDRNVNFPVNVVKQRRVRFAPFVAAACLAVFATAGSVLLMLNTNEGDLPQVSFEYSVDSLDDHSATSQIGEASDPYEESKEASVSEASDDEDESRFPFGESDVSDETSGNEASGGETSDDDIPKVEYPSDAGFYKEHEISNLLPDEFFATNPNKTLDGKSELPIYKRNEITADVGNTILASVEKAFSVDFIGLIEADRNLVCNSDNTLCLRIDNYGDWRLFGNDSLIVETKNLKDRTIENTAKMLIENNPEIFGAVEFEYVICQAENLATVKIFEKSTDFEYCLYPSFEFVFGIKGDSSCGLISVKSNANGMLLVENYPIRSYNEAIIALFSNEISNVLDLDYSENGVIEFVIVGYDVRYLYTEGAEGVYPYYAFVINTDPNGQAPCYKTAFLPAIKEKHLTITEFE